MRNYRRRLPGDLVRDAVIAAKAVTKTKTIALLLGVSGQRVNEWLRYRNLPRSDQAQNIKNMLLTLGLTAEADRWKPGK